MRFKIILLHIQNGTSVIPINYQYPLSVAIYKVLQKADGEYSKFLHQSGYGKGFKLFTFSDIKCPFKIQGDRLLLSQNKLEIIVSFHLPEATQNFIKGLFLSQQIDIADKKSKAVFTVASVEALPNLLGGYKDDEIINVRLKPISPLIAATKPDGRKHAEYLSPEDDEWQMSVLNNWKEKIKLFYEINDAEPLSITPKFFANPPKPRLITIKANTPEETKIRGFVNFEMEVLGRKKFVELLLNSGAASYNAQGMGSVEVIAQ